MCLPVMIVFLQMKITQINAQLKVMRFISFLLSRLHTARNHQRTFRVNYFVLRECERQTDRQAGRECSESEEIKIRQYYEFMIVLMSFHIRQYILSKLKLFYLIQFNFPFNWQMIF